MIMQKLRDPRVMKAGMWIILGITIPSFVLFYGFSKTDGAGGYNRTDLVTVKNADGTTKLGTAELRVAEEQMPAELVQMAQAFGIVDMRNYQAEVANVRRTLKPKEKADYAVAQLALRQRLAKQGIRVTDTQVKRLLTDGKMTREELNRRLKMYRMSEYQYAAMMRDQIASDQAANTISRFAHTSLIELYNNYVGSSEKITVTLARVPAQPDMNFTPSDEEISAKYKSLLDAKDPRTIQAEQRVYNYVKLEMPAIAPQRPTEEQLHEAYDKMPADDKSLIKPATTLLRSILVSFPGGTDEKVKEPARAKAQEALDRVKAGQDFATVANEVSEDPRNTVAGENGAPDQKRGGELPNPVSENEARIYGEKYAEFVKSAEIGTVSDVIETPNGFVVLRVEGRNPEGRMDFEAARSIVTRNVQQQLNQKMMDERNAVASEKLKTLREAAAQESTLEGIARVVNSTVRETSPTTSLSTFINGPGSLNSSADALKSLKPKGRTDVLQNSQSEPVILMIKEVIPERKRELPEIKDVVISIIREERADKAAKEKAEALKARVVAGDSLTSAAAEMQVVAETLPPFSRGDDPRMISPQLMGLENVNLAIASAKKGEVSVLREGRAGSTLGYSLFQVTDAETPTVQDFLKNMRAVETATLALKSTAFVAEFRRDAVKDAKVTYDPMYVTPEKDK
ncbi:peptidyl-prolyl cis-trans isomerase [Candidatus Sumerlaeota bacterium]|nr:peptidyl-prolyl cis-trans isomerase [Candidatus Sumerlaeota bacterium]